MANPGPISGLPSEVSLLPDGGALVEINGDATCLGLDVNYRPVGGASYVTRLHSGAGVRTSLVDPAKRRITVRGRGRVEPEFASIASWAVTFQLTVTRDYQTDTTYNVIVIGEPDVTLNHQDGTTSWTLVTEEY